MTQPLLAHDLPLSEQNLKNRIVRNVNNIRMSQQKNDLAKLAIMAISPISSISPCKKLNENCEKSENLSK